MPAEILAAPAVAQKSEAALAAPYVHSPKVIVVTGMTGAGKTHTARLLRETFGYEILGIDSICAKISQAHDVTFQHLESFAYFDEFKQHFTQELTQRRFKNLVIEGYRVNHEHVLCALLEALFTKYGDYIIVKMFHLDPGEAERRRFFKTRHLDFVRKSMENAGAGRTDPQLEAMKELPFFPGHAQLQPGFDLVESPAPILKWAAKNATAKHPALLPAYADLIEGIAGCGAINPFYQTVEVDGHLVIRGFTESWKSWDRIQQLQIPFQGSTVCDIGCMLGYFSFKAEEAGGICTGYDIDAGAIDGARLVAKARGSNCRFKAHDVSSGLGGDFDIVMALNVLHRVREFEVVVRHILSACRTAILEVGEQQMRPVMLLAKHKGFRLGKMIISHRSSSVVGQRVIAVLHRGE